MTGEALAYVIGAAALFVIQRMGWFPALTPSPAPTPAGPAVPSPLSPVPVAPTPTPPPEVDRPLAEFLPWLMLAKSGKVQMDDHDWEYLELVRTTLAGLPGRK